MFIHNLNPILLSLGPFQVRYYGLSYVLGFFLSIWWLQYWRKKGVLKITSDDVWDFMFYALLGVLIGARLFMLIWRPDVYLRDPVELLRFWNGGMSFHGGLVGIVVAGYYFCKKKGIEFFKIADLMSFPTLFALALGRIANFMNGELVGRASSAPWCVVFPGYEGCRHPSTLYAAAKRFLVSGYLALLTFRVFNPRPSQESNAYKSGFIFLNFLLFEGLGRFIVDFYREDILHFGLSLGQWMSLLMVVVALYFLYFHYKGQWKLLLRSTTK